MALQVDVKQSMQVTLDFLKRKYDDKITGIVGMSSVVWVSQWTPTGPTEPPPGPGHFVPTSEGPLFVCSRSEEPYYSIFLKPRSQKGEMQRFNMGAEFTMVIKPPHIQLLVPTGIWNLTFSTDAEGERQLESVGSVLQAIVSDNASSLTALASTAATAGGAVAQQQQQMAAASKPSPQANKSPVRTPGTAHRVGPPNDLLQKLFNNSGASSQAPANALGDAAAAPGGARQQSAVTTARDALAALSKLNVPNHSHPTTGNVNGRPVPPPLPPPLPMAPLHPPPKTPAQETLAARLNHALLLQATAAQSTPDPPTNVLQQLFKPACPSSAAAGAAQPPVQQPLGQAAVSTLHPQGLLPTATWLAPDASRPVDSPGVGSAPARHDAGIGSERMQEGNTGAQGRRESSRDAKRKAVRAAVARLMQDESVVDAVTAALEACGFQHQA